MIVHWIWLATRPHISDRVKAELVRAFQDPETIYFADKQALRQFDGLTQEGLEALEDKNLRPAEKILRECGKENLHILTCRDAAYPQKLLNLSDYPLVFYYKGRLPDFDGSPVIGVVGTRKATPYGLTVAKRMGYQIAKCGGILVSGMAAGIDGFAMRGALTAGGTAVGILGCGADVVYPPSNKGLFQDTESYGCILSEFPPGTPPYGYNFPKRNRIISGLSNGVLIVEAPDKSGALITAGLAADQGRDVFVVPGNIDVPSCVGSNRLLRDGAIAVSSGWDILSEYEAQYPDKVRQNDAASIQRAYADEAAEASEAEKPVAKVAQKPRILGKNKPLKSGKDKKVIDNGASSPYSDLNDILAALSDDERKIVSALQSGERLTDDVIAETGLGTGKVLANLTMLEVKGVVKRLPGKRISLKQGK